jgi:hypothetical protein
VFSIQKLSNLLSFGLKKVNPCVSGHIGTNYLRVRTHKGMLGFLLDTGLGCNKKKKHKGMLGFLLDTGLGCACIHDILGGFCIPASR